jgi:hypothetical protein
VLADAHNTGFLFGDPQIVQLANGTLVVVSHFPASLGGGTRALSSADHGATWSALGNPQPSVPVDVTPSACGAPLGLENQGGQYAVVHGRTIIGVTTVNETGSGPAKVIMTRSDDAGRTWTSSTVYSSPLPIGLASIATDASGRIGMTFTQADMAHVQCSPSPVIPVRTEFVVSSDEGHTWSSPLTIGAPWWNMASAPVMVFFGSWWVGDYTQVAAVPGRGFAVAVVQGKPVGDGAGAPPVTGLQSVIVAEVAASGAH